MASNDPIGSKVLAKNGRRGVIVNYTPDGYPLVYGSLSGTTSAWATDGLNTDPDQTRFLTAVYAVNYKPLSFWKIVWAIVVAEFIIGIIGGLLLLLSRA